MLWVKRIICGVIALAFIVLGIRLINGSEQLWQAIGFCFFVGGITLAYIAVMEHLPSYTFWITLTALGLAYALYTTKATPISEEEQQIISSRLEKEMKKSKELLNDKTATVHENNKVEKTQRKTTGFNLSAYPKISGSAAVIHAHVFYIGGRYVRLFGVDAPDTDQVCSNSTGSSYNCGEEAASWVRGWIDQNPIDCYILKVNPNGQDLATCIWGEYDIGAALVGAGWGIANTRETTIYAPYEAKAQSESSGLWQGSFYAPEDWRDIKRSRKDFTIKKTSQPKSGGFFNFGSLF